MNVRAKHDMLLILGVQPKTLQSEPQMHTPTEMELQVKHEPTVADMSESLIYIYLSVLPMYKNTDHEALWDSWSTVKLKPKDL